MDTKKASRDIDQGEINPHRRRFFGTAAMTVAAAQLGMIGASKAQPTQTTSASVPAIKPGTNTSFAPLKQIDAGVLNIGYAEAGPAAGPPVAGYGSRGLASHRHTAAPRPRSPIRLLGDPRPFTPFVAREHSRGRSCVPGKLAGACPDAFRGGRLSPPSSRGGRRLRGG